MSSNSNLSLTPSKDASKASIDTTECKHQIIHISLGNTASEIKKALTAYTKNSFKFCPNCGSLVPELKLELNDLTFTLMMFEKRQFVIDEEATKKEKEYWIKEGEPEMASNCLSDLKIVTETDYRKLCSYLIAKGYGPSGDASK